MLQKAPATHEQLGLHWANSSWRLKGNLTFPAKESMLGGNLGHRNRCQQLRALHQACSQLLIGKLGRREEDRVGIRRHIVAAECINLFVRQKALSTIRWRRISGHTLKCVMYQNCSHERNPETLACKTGSCGVTCFIENSILISASPFLIGSSLCRCTPISGTWFSFSAVKMALLMGINSLRSPFSMCKLT